MAVTKVDSEYIAPNLYHQLLAHDSNREQFDFAFVFAENLNNPRKSGSSAIRRAKQWFALLTGVAAYLTRNSHITRTIRLALYGDDGTRW